MVFKKPSFPFTVTTLQYTAVRLLLSALYEKRDIRHPCSGQRQRLHSAATRIPIKTLLVSFSASSLALLTLRLGVAWQRWWHLQHLQPCGGHSQSFQHMQPRALNRANSHESVTKSALGPCHCPHMRHAPPFQPFVAPSTSPMPSFNLTFGKLAMVGGLLHCFTPIPLPLHMCTEEGHSAGRGRRTRWL